MNNTDRHIDLTSSIKKNISNEFLSELLQVEKLGTACYLQIINRIVDSVISAIVDQRVFSANSPASVMTINEVKSMLNYKDLRSVLNWCRQNDVFVLNQGNSQFVNRSEFLLAFYKPFLTHLKSTGSNWKELFIQYVQGELRSLLKDEDVNEPIKHYKPKSKIEKSFLSKINKL